MGKTILEVPVWSKYNTKLFQLFSGIDYTIFL